MENTFVHKPASATPLSAIKLAVKSDIDSVEVGIGFGLEGFYPCESCRFYSRVKHFDRGTAGALFA
jgi:hypothetical protein